MKFNYLRPMIWSAQFEETIQFYTEVLGFTVGERNDEWGWAAMHRDEVEIMLAKPNEHMPFDTRGEAELDGGVLTTTFKPSFTGSFYINTDEVDALWEQLKGKAKICYEIDNFDWEMREFAIYDNNGYLLQFGQNINTLK